MTYKVASIGKYHRPNRIYANTKSKSIALEEAEKTARKLKIKVGIFGYENGKYYGLFDVFYGYMY